MSGFDNLASIMKAVWVLLLASGLACVNAKSVRIYGGDVTTIDQYPTIAAMLTTVDMSFYFRDCGGTIINTRSILSAAHCFTNPLRPVLHRVRVGSTWANSGGTVHSVISILNHPLYDVMSPIDSDISIVRTASDITYINNAVQPGTFAGPNYNTGDNSVVWAAGWGRTETGFASEQLRHVQLLTVNHEVCRQRYGFIITDNMLCAGWLDIGGRGQCSGDSGGPLYHNGVVVGVCSFGNPACNSDYFPGVNVRVSRFIDWIQANA